MSFTDLGTLGFISQCIFWYAIYAYFSNRNVGRKTPIKRDEHGMEIGTKHEIHLHYGDD